MPEVIVRPATPADSQAIADLHRAAFGGDAEVRLVEELQAAGDVRLSLVAERDGEIVGHVLFSELMITPPDGDVLRGLSLAPLAVLPKCQRQGVGTQLTRDALARLREEGWPLVIVLGDPVYYGRFGFNAETASQLQSVYAGPYFLALNLHRADDIEYRGRVTYAAPFAALS